MTYLDYNATTPVDPRVMDTMVPFFAESFGNPSSVHHRTGQRASGAVEHSRRQVAQAIGMKEQDVIFTSGATEANNLALAGRSRILAGATEHKSVLQTCRENGSSFRIIPVFEDGTLSLTTLEKELTKGADVVSVMAANSETGVIHPIKKIAKLAHEHGALFHCDATQALGKIPFYAPDYDIDMVTLSSHKIYGPKGCGALVANRESRRNMAGMIHGGGQERDLRSGTLNVPAIVGFGRACDIAVTEGLQDAPRQRTLRDEFEKEMAAMVGGIGINGGTTDRLPNTSNMRIRGALADAVVSNMKTVEISTGSACSSSTMEPSHVLTAMGLDRTAADESLRITLGRQTTQDDMRAAMQEITQAVDYVRSIEEKGVA